MPAFTHTLTAGALHGIDIVNTSGEPVGKLEDVVLDMRSGRALYGVILLNQPCELGRRMIAAPWETLILDAIHDRFMINVSMETVSDAPAFPAGALPDMTDPGFRQSVNEHFGLYYRAA